MSNSYFTYSNVVARLSRARSSWANTLGAAMEAAFDLLPTPTALFTETANYGEDEGSANAYAVTLPKVGAYIDGLKVRVKIGTSNTGASTLNVSGLGARAIKRPDGTDPGAGDFAAGKVHEFSYDETSSTFQVLTVTSADLAAAAASASAAASSASAAAISAIGSSAARDKAQMWAEAAEDTEVESGQFSALHHAAKAAESAASLVNLAGKTEALTLTGTAVDVLSAIPAGARVIELLFHSMSLDAASNIVVQLGTAAGVVEAGYTQTAAFLDGSGLTSDGGGLSIPVTSPASGYTGNLRLVRGEGNRWVGSYVMRAGTGGVVAGAGHVELPGEIDRIRVRSNNGTAAFDAGTLTLVWEV